MNEKERYQKYLASREWWTKRMAVMERCGGNCERCHSYPVDAVHHLTYIRKYDELLTDLQGICKACHDFIHARSNVDPCDPVQFASTKRVPSKPEKPNGFNTYPVGLDTTAKTWRELPDLGELSKETRLMCVCVKQTKEIALVVDSIGLKHDEVWIATIAKPGDEWADQPTPVQVVTHLPIIERHIAKLLPQFLCLVGKLPAATLLETALPLERLRGKWHTYRGIPTVVMADPNQSDMVSVLEDTHHLMKRMGIKRVVPQGVF
jgi:hypothetical protein